MGLVLRGLVRSHPSRERSQPQGLSQPAAAFLGTITYS